MINFFKQFFAAALMATVLVSCGSDSESKRIDEINNCFVDVTDIVTRDNYGFKGVSYNLEFNYTTGLANITINNLKLPGDRSFATVNLTGLKFSINKEGWMEISSSRAEGVVAGSSSKLDFSSLDFRLSTRIMSDGSIPCFYAYYNVDSKYSILSAAAIQYQFGTTSSSSSAGNYETTSTDYVLAFDAETRTVDILMKNCRFVEKMPAMDILLEDVPYTLSGTTASFNVDEIIPKIGDTPYPGFAITDFTGYYNFATGFVASFKCKPQTMPFEFTISIDCKYTFSK